MKKNEEKKSEKKEMTIVGSGFSLDPKTMDEAMVVCKMLAESDLVPKEDKGKPGNILIKINMGHEIGIKPLQSLQNIAVINGKPGIYGDIGKALLLSNGFKIELRDTKEAKLKNEAWCKITRPDGATAERTYSVEDAKTAGLWSKQGPWSTNPYNQLGWRAFWFCARDVAADVLKGLAGAEELEDYEVKPSSNGAAPANQFMPKAVEAEVLPQATAAPEPAADTEEPLPETETPQTLVVEIVVVNVTQVNVDKKVKGYNIKSKDGGTYFTPHLNVAMTARDSSKFGAVVEVEYEQRPDENRIVSLKELGDAVESK